MASPRWQCSSCGLSMGRRRSCERHIQNFHHGNAESLPLKNPRDIPPHLLQPMVLPTVQNVSQTEQLLPNSRVLADDILIGVEDLRDPNWISAFASKFAEVMATDSDGNPGIKHAYPGIILNYFGYVCPICFGVGVTTDAKFAESSQDGDHVCPLRNQLENTSRIEVVEPSTLDRLKNEMQLLLYEMITTIAEGRQVVLVGDSGACVNFRDLVRQNREITVGKYERDVLDSFSQKIPLNNYELKDYLRSGRTQSKIILTDWVNDYPYYVRLAIEA